MQPRKFRKKPVVIEAIRWDGKEETFEAIRQFSAERMVGRNRASGYLLIRTPEGVMKAMIGDWIIKGVRGEIYPCKPDIFEQTYEEVKIDDFGEQ